MIALPAVALGIGLVWVVNYGLGKYADHTHESAQKTLRGELTKCRADVARYAEIVELEKAYAERRPGR